MDATLAMSESLPLQLVSLRVLNALRAPTLTNHLVQLHVRSAISASTQVRLDQHLALTVNLARTTL